MGLLCSERSARRHMLRRVKVLVYAGKHNHWIKLGPAFWHFGPLWNKSSRWCFCRVVVMNMKSISFCSCGVKSLWVSFWFNAMLFLLERFLWRNYSKTSDIYCFYFHDGARKLDYEYPGALNESGTNIIKHNYQFLIFITCLIVFNECQ